MNLKDRDEELRGRGRVTAGTKAGAIWPRIHFFAQRENSTTRDFARAFLINQVAERSI